MTPEEAKELIKEKSEYAIGALITLYRMQTPDEQSANMTAYQNDYGFNAFDADILSSISKWYLKKNYLTEKQLKLVRLKIPKYASQLISLDFQPIDVPKVEATQKKKKEKFRKIEVIDAEKLKVSFSFDRKLVDYVKSIHGRRYRPEEKCWSVPWTLNNVEKLLEEKFELDAELKKWHKKQTEGITDLIKVPGLDDILMPYQKEGVSFIEVKNGRALIADEMGLGKTLQALAWMVYRGKAIFPTIIICPASLKLNWMKEFVKFTNLSDQVETVQGYKTYPITKPIVIINYDILPPQHDVETVIEYGKKKKKRTPVKGTGWADYIVKHVKPKLIIADEMHYTKSPKTLRTAAMRKLAKNTDYFIGLTGTPILNRPKEIFEPLRMISPLLFPAWTQFAYRYCGPGFNGFATTFDGATNTIELNKILTREVMLRRKKEDVLKELPPKRRAIVPLEMTNRAEYEEAEADFIRYLSRIDIEKAEKAKKAETLVKMNALKQLAVKGKLDMATKWIADFIESEKMVTFCTTHKTIDHLKAKFKKSCVVLDGRVSEKKRQEAVDRFQTEDDVRLFIGMIDSFGRPAGVGHTLTASSNPSFIEYQWSPGVLVQAEDRTHRIGQLDSVTSWNLVAADTIEEDIITVIEGKAKTIAEVIDGDETQDRGVFNEILRKFMERR